MLSLLRTQSTMRASSSFGRIFSSGSQVRFLATVQTTAPGRQPLARPKGTPVSRERATLTIKVLGPLCKIYMLA
jgi:hypothetical protein